jgi:uncharacterized membrane protein
MKSENKHGICSICRKTFSPTQLRTGLTIRQSILNYVIKDHPDFQSHSLICQKDLSHYRGQYVQSLLEREKGELDTLEKSVVESLKNQDLISSNVQVEFQEKLTLGQRVADRIASFGGSWPFLISFFIFLVIWIIINIVNLGRPFDPYPFILLNLILSCLASVQAPIIMMSQNRQASKDRVRSDHEYQVNLKAELEVRHLHEKMDHLLTQQWQRLVEIQQVQIEMLEEVTGKGRSRK